MEKAREIVYQITGLGEGVNKNKVLTHRKWGTSNIPSRRPKIGRSRKGGKQRQPAMKRGKNRGKKNG